MRTKRSYCLNCGTMLDAATPAFEVAKPAPGDFSICFYCGHLMVFDENVLLRNPNDAEILQLAGNPRVLAVQKARAKVRPKQ